MSEAVLARLSAVDERLRRESPGPLRTLDPQREQATPLPELHRQLLATMDTDVRAELAPVLAAGLAKLAEAQLAAFPANLFWDFDLIGADLCAQAQAADAPAALLADRFARMAALQHLYGRDTAINFSYVHDFSYGFDWAKWVAREPSLHADPPGPFSLAFLDYMQRRGHELLALIAQDDRKYPSLPRDEARNPFPFSREPAAELRLHRELAKRGLIPVPAWDLGATSLDWGNRWREPFADRRVEVAAELGLLDPPATGDS